MKIESPLENRIHHRKWISPKRSFFTNNIGKFTEVSLKNTISDKKMSNLANKIPNLFSEQQISFSVNSVM